MMRAIWNIISSTGSSDASGFPSFNGGGRTQPLTIVRRAQARGMKLSVDPRDATVRLTLGHRAPLKPALGWAAGKRQWVEAELARLPRPQPIVPDMEFTLAGEPVRLDWNAAYPRKAVLSEGALQVGGPRDSLGPRILRYLRAHARTVLTDETRSLAAVHDIAVGEIGVGDPKGRWGSCASSGNIRYSWRLILAPAHVRRATVAHEVAHRVHMNHGADFHTLVAVLNGEDPGLARRWLRAHGAALHWFGRDG